MELARLPMISLQRQALTNFASSVWISANKQYLPLPLEINHKSMTDRAIDELKHSVIGKHIKEMTMMILEEVGYEICHWLSKIKNHVTTTILEHHVANLSWTVEGSLNRPKMARLLLENQSDLDLEFSFKMACKNCLEDKIRELWPRIREERQLKGFYDENLMVKYWIYKLGRLLLDSPEFSFLDPLLEEMSIDIKFLVRVVCSWKYRKSNVQFLFNNLCEDEKIEALDIISNYSRAHFLQFSGASGLGYLLSQLNYTQMCELLSKFKPPEELLMNISYFAWPNTHFLKALDHCNCIGKKEGAIEVTNGNDLVEFADGAFEFVRRYNRTILFRYCWTRFPREELNKVIRFFDIIISDLAFYDDVGSIKMVIDSIDPESYANNLLIPYHFQIYATLDEYDTEYDTDLLKYYLARCQ